MDQIPSFQDIHCHLLPAIDDGADSIEESLAMARMAVADGITDIVVTPHQLGNHQQNTGPLIREHARTLQERLRAERIELRIHPGGDVRIEEGMLDGIRRGDVMTLADHRKHILLELPHELYYPLEGLIESLAGAGIQSILSHPERNQGLLRRPEIVGHLVDAGCLMQVTAGSLVGTFGPRCQQMSEVLLTRGWVHFLATDAHGINARRPLLSRAFQRAVELVGWDIAVAICHANPRSVVQGVPIDLSHFDGRMASPTAPPRPKQGWLRRLASA